MHKNSRVQRIYVKLFTPTQPSEFSRKTETKEVSNTNNVGFEIKVSSLTPTISQTIQCDCSGSRNENPVPQTSNPRNPNNKRMVGVKNYPDRPKPFFTTTLKLRVNTVIESSLPRRTLSFQSKSSNGRAASMRGAAAGVMPCSSCAASSAIATAKLAFPHKPCLKLPPDFLLTNDVARFYLWRL